MNKEIPNLITKCCINHKLHTITQDQLSSQLPLSTVLFTMEEITLINVLDWLFVRFPHSEVHLATQLIDSHLLNCLLFHLSAPYQNSYRINSLHLYLPSAEFGTEHGGSLPPRLTVHDSHHHDINSLLLIKSPKGYAVLQGAFPTTFDRITLASMTYSNSKVNYDQSIQLLKEL